MCYLAYIVWVIKIILFYFLLLHFLFSEKLFNEYSRSVQEKEFRVGSALESSFLGASAESNVIIIADGYDNARQRYFSIK